MFQLIRSLSATQTGVVFAVVFILGTWACIIFLGGLRKRLMHRGRSANEMIGFTLASFSTVYGIMLGLLAVEAYQDFSSVRDSVSKEALSLTTFNRDLDAYPEPMRSHLQSELYKYVKETIQESWPTTGHSIVEGQAVSSRLRSMFGELLSFQPTTTSAGVIHSENLRRINTLMDMRRARVTASGDGIPNLMWVVLFLGAFIHTALFALFDMDRAPHLILGSALALFLGSAIFLIAALDDPFSGGVTISPSAFDDALKWIKEPVVPRT